MACPVGPTETEKYRTVQDCLETVQNGQVDNEPAGLISHQHGILHEQFHGFRPLGYRDGWCVLAFGQGRNGNEKEEGQGNVQNSIHSFLLRSEAGD